MNTSPRYRLNEPTVIQEIIDGEAIIADLGRGFYYSMDGLGSRIWNALIRGGTVDEIINVCAMKFPVERESVAAGIRGLLDRLQEEQLIVPITHAAGEAIDILPLFNDLEESYGPPVLSKYTDMEQLLLLDPIHDVDETGWPKAPGVPAGDQ